MAVKMTDAQDQILPRMVAENRAGRGVGIAAVCSSHPVVLRTAMRHAVQHGTPLLVESTSNQVNQFGGYTGQTPQNFAAMLIGLAREAGLPPERLLLGGDHLGPNAWQDQAAESAIQKACDLVAACVSAGYRKIHLDASMHLGGDPAGPLPVEVCAARAARLAHAAELAARQLPEDAPMPVYVIGSEVPPPGGAKAAGEELQVTAVENARQTLALTRRAFEQHGVGNAFERVIALVVQPGVEFGDQDLHPYRREAAAALSAFILEIPGMVYEAHSTDYQSPAALRMLVEDHFAILKVGPALTFAYREALFALEAVEMELLPPEERSGLSRALESEMLANPAHWRRYYHGDDLQQALSRRYSFSDRIRYYWGAPGVGAAVERLLENLSARRLPLNLIQQYLPDEAQAVREAQLPVAPLELVMAHIEKVLEDYRAACMTAPRVWPHQIP